MAFTPFLKNITGLMLMMVLLTTGYFPISSAELSKTSTDTTKVEQDSSGLDLTRNNVFSQTKSNIQGFLSSSNFIKGDEIDVIVDGIMELLPLPCKDETPVSQWKGEEDTSSVVDGSLPDFQGVTLGNEAQTNRTLTVQLFSRLSTEDWISIIMTLVCVCCAALAAGLTLGLISLEPLDLMIKVNNETNKTEQRQAKAILPLLKNPRQLLVTLLLFNSLANEAMPIFLDDLVPEYVAVILSVTLVLVFGEIIPSAIFTGPRQLAIVSKLTWLVKALLWTFHLLAWPLAKILDRLLGEEGMKKYTRDELLHLVTLHHKAEILARESKTEEELLAESIRENSGSFSTDRFQHNEKTPLRDSVRKLRQSTRMGREYGLTEDEVDIMTGAIKTMKSIVEDIYTHISNVFSLPIDQKLDYDTMAAIMASGFSRVLVYQNGEPQNICGFLLVKKLIVLDPEDARPIEPEWLKLPICVSPKMPLLDLLNMFQEGHSHIALVSNAPHVTEAELKKNQPLKGASSPIGIVTLEDIIETIIQEEVMDETSMMERKANQLMRRYIRKLQDKKKKREYQGKQLDAIKRMNSKSLNNGGHNHQEDFV